MDRKKFVTRTWLTTWFWRLSSHDLQVVLFSHSVVSDSLWPHGLQYTRLPCPSLSPRVCSNSCPLSQPHGLQYTRLPCPSLSPRVCSNSCPLSQWRHRTISSSVTPFSSCPQSFPISGSFPMSWLSISGGQSIGVSASTSVIPMNIQGWFPLGWTSLILLLSKGLSKVFSSTTVRKHQFFKLETGKARYAAPVWGLGTRGAGVKVPILRG